MREKIRVLYVDDNRLDRALVRDALVHAHGGFLLTEAAARDEFEFQLTQREWDIVLSDFNILGFEGLQVLDAVHTRSPTLPVVIVTGTGSEEIAVESMKRGAADYVLKTPRHIQRLPHTLISVLESQRLGMATRRAADDLRRSEERYRMLFETMAQGAVYQDADGLIIQANPAAERILGMPLAGMRSRTAFAPGWHAVHEDGSPFNGNDHPGNVALRRGAVIRNVPMGILNPVEGAYRWINVHAVPQFRPGKDKPHLVYTTFEDITERKHAVDALHNATREWRATFDAVSDAVWVLDVDGRIRRGNKATLTHFGHEPDDIVGKYCWDVINGTTDPVPDCPVERMKRTLRRETLEMAVGERAFSVTVDPIFDGAGRLEGAVLQVSDISERKRAEAERLALEGRMQEAQRLESLGVLAGGVAHDFNNLLTVVLGHGEMSLIDAPRGSDLHESLQEIVNASRRASDLCGQLLAYAGRGQYVIEEIRLDALVDEMLDLLKSFISKKTVLRVDPGQELPRVRGDTTQIRQVVMNLVINAAEAIGDEAGTVTVAFGTTVCPDEGRRFSSPDFNLSPGHYVWLEVADTGCGMSRETLKHIFEPFYTTKFIGRGLGLSSALGIARGHNGALHVTSEPGRGSTFTLLLPAAVAPSAPPPADQATPDWTGAGAVLLVDDEAIVRKIGRRILEHMGFEVLTACDGQEALEVFREEQDRIECVLLDMTMPHMDGLEALAAFRRIAPAIPIVLSSGYSETDVISRFADARPTAFVHKPYTPQVLRNCLSRIVPNRSAGAHPPPRNSSPLR